MVIDINERSFFFLVKTCFENYTSLSETISSLPSNCDQLKNTNILTNNIPVGKWGGIIGELVSILVFDIFDIFDIFFISFIYLFDFFFFF